MIQESSSHRTLRWREMDSNFWYRGTKPWISAAFRALRGIGGALERYDLIVQPFFCPSNSGGTGIAHPLVPMFGQNDDHGGMRIAAIPAIFWVKYCRERRMAQSVTLLGCGDVGPIHGPSTITAPSYAMPYWPPIRFAQVDIFRGAFIPRVWRLPTRRAPQNQSPISLAKGWDHLRSEQLQVRLRPAWRQPGR